MNGVVKLENGRWGIVGDSFSEDNDWGEYPDEATAMKARQALEESDWNADVVRGLYVI